MEDEVVTINTAGCQKEIAEKIVEAGGDYVLALKGNQQTLHKTVVDYFTKHIENDSPRLRSASMLKSSTLTGEGENFGRQYGLVQTLRNQYTEAGE